MSRVARRLFGISPREVAFDYRRFRGGDPQTRAHIEKIGFSFLEGYHGALEASHPDALLHRLHEVESAERGFAFEGAAMGLTLLDAMTPWRRTRLRHFLENAGDAHVYMAHVGAGWAIARLPFGFHSVLARLDPLLSWLAFDGYGFHQGYFHWPTSIEGRQEIPSRVKGYARRVFDQGLGRSLWFVEGADVRRIPATIATFEAPRRRDLWAGVGLASTYAGGVGRAELEALLEASGAHRWHLLQGVTFAAEARRRAGNPTHHTALACEVFCQLSVAEAAGLTEKTRRDLPADAEMPAYEVWKQRIQKLLAEHLGDESPEGGTPEGGTPEGGTPEGGTPL